MRNFLNNLRKPLLNYLQKFWCLYIVMVWYAGKRQHFQINSGSKHSNKSICLPAQKGNMNRYLIMAVPWNSHYHYSFGLYRNPFLWALISSQGQADGGRTVVKRTIREISPPLQMEKPLVMQRFPLQVHKRFEWEQCHLLEGHWLWGHIHSLVITYAICCVMVALGCYLKCITEVLGLFHQDFIKITESKWERCWESPKILDIHKE